MKQLRSNRWWGPVMFGGMIVGAWYALKLGLELPSYQLPSPGEVLGAFVDESSTLLRAASTTARGAALGFGAALSLGFLLSVGLAASARARRAVFPYIIVMQMIPIIASAAIIVMWLDVGMQTVAVIAFLLGFFPVVANTLQGLTAVPQPMVELYALYGASRWQTMWRLRVPYALPAFFTGAQIAATLAVIGSVTGEIFAGSTRGGGGLGFLIIVYKSSLKMPEIFATTAVACALGFGFVASVAIIRRRVLSAWSPSA